MPKEIGLARVPAGEGSGGPWALGAACHFPVGGDGVFVARQRLRAQSVRPTPRPLLQRHLAPLIDRTRMTRATSLIPPHRPHGPQSGLAYTILGWTARTG